MSVQSLTTKSTPIAAQPQRQETHPQQTWEQLLLDFSENTVGLASPTPAPTTKPALKRRRSAPRTEKSNPPPVQPLPQPPIPTFNLNLTSTRAIELCTQWLAIKNIHPESNLRNFLLYNSLIENIRSTFEINPNLTFNEFVLLVDSFNLT